MQRTAMTARSAALGFGFTLALTFSALAQSGARIEKLEVVNEGFVSTEKRGSRAAPGSVGGVQRDVGKVQFFPDSPPVTAKTGVSFGVEFRPRGPRRDAIATLRTVWKVPAPGITDPKSGNTYRDFGTNFPVREGKVFFRGYTILESWEVVRGDWTLEIWQDDRKLLERTFAIK